MLDYSKDTPRTLHEPEKAEATVKVLNADARDPWTYAVERAGELARIVITDENERFVNYL